MSGGRLWEKYEGRRAARSCARACGVNNFDRFGRIFISTVQQTRFVETAPLNFLLSPHTPGRRGSSTMASDHASRRAAPSLLVLVRAAVEGAAEETLAEMQARVRADSISGEGSAGSSAAASCETIIFNAYELPTVTKRLFHRLERHK